MNRASGTCGTTINDLVFIFLKSEFQKEGIAIEAEKVLE